MKDELERDRIRWQKIQREPVSPPYYFLPHALSTSIKLTSHHYIYVYVYVYVYVCMYMCMCIYPHSVTSKHQKSPFRLNIYNETKLSIFPNVCSSRDLRQNIYKSIFKLKHQDHTTGQLRCYLKGIILRIDSMFQIFFV